MKRRVVSVGAALVLALLPGCSPKKAAQQALAPSSAPVTALPATTPTPTSVQTAPAFRALNLGSLRQRVPVLTYHDVIASRQQPDAVWFDCTAAEFEAQMKFLHDQGAVVVTLEQLRRHLTTGEPLPDRAIALTFDDSYQGVYDLAAPVLKRYGYPYAVFVHTDYVGSRKGRPKMTWDELRDLDRSGLVTIGSHSRSHPADMGQLSAAQQDEELRGSKQALETNLGHPVTFVSYPNGKADALTFERARQAGYTLGFMEEWGPVEQSPDILALNRYIHIQLPRAWAETYGPEPLPEGVNLTLTDVAASTVQTVSAGVPLVLRRGGTLDPRLADGRALVAGDFLAPKAPLWLASHAAGGLPLGPYLEAGGVFVPESDPGRLNLVQGRPLVAWNAGTLALLPFVPGPMNAAAPLQAELPGLRGAFVAQAWLVQGGQARSSAGILATGTSDLRTLRRRVFLGVTAAGEVLLGVSAVAVSARQLALAAAAAGAREAVLVY